jgi:AraC family transcriptional regulator
MKHEPTTVQRAAFIVVGMQQHGTTESIPKDVPPMWGRLMQRAGEIKHMINRREAFGVIGMQDPATREFDYVAGFEVSDDSEVPEGMVSWNIPAQTYAVFACSLPTLMETFRDIYHRWLPQSQRRRGDGPEFELYGEDFNPADPDSRMYVYVPIK